MTFRVMVAAWCLLVAQAGSAGAQDLWTGFYAGGTLGRQSFDTHWKTNCISAGFPGAECPDFTGGFAERFNNDNPVDFGDKSARFGGFAGAQIQLFQVFVVGVEGDGGIADNKSVRGGIPGTLEPLSTVRYGPDEVTVSADWDASVRGRLGFLITPTTMLYGAAGVSWMKVEATAICRVDFNNGGNGDGYCLQENVGFRDTVEETVQGYTVGGGIETLITPNLLFRAEFRHAQHNELRHVFFDGLSRNADAVSATITNDTDTVTLGLGFKF